MLLPGREWQEGYRFGFNGKENSDEIYGDDNALDFGSRVYDPRIGKFISLDPMYFKYPFWSPYIFAANCSLKYVDVNGEGPGDVIVIYPGADVFYAGGKGEMPKFTRQIDIHLRARTAINVFTADYHGIDLTNSEDLDHATEEAFIYVMSHYEKDFNGNCIDVQGQVVLYGYSWGGALVNHLAKRLKDEGIPVDLMITVDAAGGPQNDAVDRTVCDNVIENVNYYQTVPETYKGYGIPIHTGSHGDPNTADDPNATVIENIDLTGTTYCTGNGEDKDCDNEVEHGTMDDATFREAGKKIADLINQ